MDAQDRKQDNYPGGRLFVLPQELRDHIYRILFNKTYLVYGIPFHHADPSRKPKREIKVDLALLRTCKVLYEEASLVLFSVAVFRFAIEYFYNAEKPPSFPPKALTDRMMNVDFILDQSYFDDNTRNWPSDISYSKLKPQADTTMGGFTGNGINRKTCGVLLWAVEYQDYDNDWLSSPMAIAISDMTGFDQITIEVEDQNVSLARSWKLASQGDEEESVAGYAEEEEGSVAGDESPADQDGKRDRSVAGDAEEGDQSVAKNAEEEDESIARYAEEEEESVARDESRADEDGKRGSQDFAIEGITNCTWAFTHQIRDAFEDKLGPGEVTFMGTRPGIATSLSLKFRPQKHQSTARGTKRKQP